MGTNKVHKIDNFTLRWWMQAICRLCGIFSQISTGKHALKYANIYTKSNIRNCDDIMKKVSRKRYK